MPSIPTIISAQSFELVRDRTAEILADEIANQFALGAEEALNLKAVALERTVPYDRNELPAVNVNLQRTTQQEHIAVNTDESVIINIDCYQSAKGNDLVRGDVLAKLKLHRLMGVARAILENPRYKTLGFAPGFIMNRKCISMDFAPVDNQDALSVSMGRISFSVRVPENTELIQPVVAAGFDTELKLELTDNGYQYTINE